VPIRRALVAALALVALFLPSAGAEPAHHGARALRVLFIGNSLTAANDLPGWVAELARRTGRRQIETYTVAPGGVSLEDHWTLTGAREMLAAADWDVVVMQQGPSSFAESADNLRTWAVRWSDEIRAHGARPALLTVWAEGNRSYVLNAVIRSYRDAALAAHAQVLPAGSAWRAAWRRKPTLPLWGPDDFHPSRLGTTLAALVAYGGLTGTRPAAVPLPDVAPSTATILRAAAADALARPTAR
jgi:hypothetical protein